MYTFVKHRHNQDIQIPAPKASSWLLNSISPSSLSPAASLPRQPRICFLSLRISLHVLEFYTHRVMKYVLPFLSVFFSLRITILRFLHLVSCINSSSFCCWVCSTVWIEEQFLSSSVGGHFSCFQVWTISNEVGVTSMYRYLYRKTFFLLGKNTYEWNGWVIW